jgi:hypothetical protein
MGVHQYNITDVAADLYARIPAPGEIELLIGAVTKWDYPATFWEYDDTSSATDNWTGNPLTSTVIKPTLAGSTGRWLKRDMTFQVTQRITSAQTLSLVGTGATGTQISSTKDSTVRFNVSTSTTSTIGGPASSVVTLKKCATNSATEADWTSAGVVQSDQTITLAVVLQSVQVVRGMLTTDVPAGWFVKLVNSGSGTHSESFISGEKTIYG